jgi:cbb3-type cytochrome oxidase subunit 3
MMQSMILIIVLLLFSLYLFWYFDRKRKIRNVESQREKRDALQDLLQALQQDNKEKTPLINEDSNET